MQHDARRLTFREWTTRTSGGPPPQAPAPLRRPARQRSVTQRDRHPTRPTSCRYRRHLAAATRLRSQTPLDERSSTQRERTPQTRGGFPSQPPAPPRRVARRRTATQRSRRLAGPPTWSRRRHRRLASLTSPLTLLRTSVAQTMVNASPLTSRPAHHKEAQCRARCLLWRRCHSSRSCAASLASDRCSFRR